MTLMRKRPAGAWLALGWLCWLPLLGAGAAEAPGKELSFAELDAATMERLLRSGSLLLVRQNPDGSLKQVLAGGLVNAPLDQVWATLTDFERYPQFMPNTLKMQVLEKRSPAEWITEQTVQVIISVLKVKLTYQHQQSLEPPNRIRFRQVSGDLPGTFGGWDLVPAGEGRQTMIFYSLYSNLMALPWPVGAILKAEPDFMTAVNVTTGLLVVKAVKQEVEKRARASNPGR